MAADRLAHAITELTIYDWRYSDPTIGAQRIEKTDLRLAQRRNLLGRRCGSDRNGGDAPTGHGKGLRERSGRREQKRDERAPGYVPTGSVA
jgi:hypothetical protein